MPCLVLSLSEQEGQTHQIGTRSSLGLTKRVLLRHQVLAAAGVDASAHRDAHKSKWTSNANIMPTLLALEAEGRIAFDAVDLAFAGQHCPGEEAVPPRCLVDLVAFHSLPQLL